MSEWWTYRPQDFLLFSERVYWRLFELHNASVWPVQIIAAVMGAGIVALVLRPRPWSGRLVALALAAAWLFVAWSFLWNSYATINWAARYVAPAFVLEAALFAWLGGIGDRLKLASAGAGGGMPGLALFLYALALHPLVAVAAGRPLAAAEVFGVAPDPTAIGTLGLLAMAGGGAATRLLLVVPLAWCAVSAATLLAMGTWEAWVPLAAIPLALLARLLRRKAAAP